MDGMVKKDFREDTWIVGLKSIFIPIKFPTKSCNFIPYSRRINRGEKPTIIFPSYSPAATTQRGLRPITAGQNEIVSFLCLLTRNPRYFTTNFQINPHGVYTLTIVLFTLAYLSASISHQNVIVRPFDVNSTGVFHDVTESCRNRDLIATFIDVKLFQRYINFSRHCASADNLSGSIQQEESRSIARVHACSDIGKAGFSRGKQKQLKGTVKGKVRGAHLHKARLKTSTKGRGKEGNADRSFPTALFSRP